MKIDIRSNAKDLSLYIKSFQKQFEKEVSRAINDTAVDTTKALKTEAEKVLDRPKPWTINQIKVKTYAKVGNNEAKIGVYTDRVEDILFTHLVHGGSRKHKSFEKALMSKGILPQGYYATPGGGVKLDKHGNIAGSTLKMILSKAGKEEQGRSAVFIVKKNGVNVGVAQRKGKAVTMLLSFVQTVRYKKTIKFFEVAEKESNNFEKHFLNRLNGGRYEDLVG